MVIFSCREFLRNYFFPPCCHSIPCLLCVMRLKYSGVIVLRINIRWLNFITNFAIYFIVEQILVGLEKLVLIEKKTFIIPRYLNSPPLNMLINNITYIFTFLVRRSYIISSISGCISIIIVIIYHLKV